MSKHQCETSIELEDGDDVPVIVFYTWGPGTPPRYFGDAPDPGSPEDWDITEVIRSDTNEQLILSDNQMNELYEYITQNEEPAEENAADYADYLYDQKRDREMEEQYEREHGDD